MIIRSDMHIHSEFSYDASLPLEEIYTKAKEYGFEKVGITDHLNLNDIPFISDIDASAKNVKEFIKTHPDMILGVELTPIDKPRFDYIAKNGGRREGYIAPSTGRPFDIELGLSKEELKARGISFAIGAAHDAPPGMTELNDLIKEWYRQQMYLACDERVTVLGHPWYHWKGVWYQDFSVIPQSMQDDLAAALKENGKYVECNGEILCSKLGSEKYHIQYAEFLRSFFERGIPVTYGSDSHRVYGDIHIESEKYLAAAGFKDGDIVSVAEKDLW